MAEPDIFSRIHTLAPVDTRLLFDRWHRDSFTHRGYVRDLKTRLMTLTRGAERRQQRQRFLILGRARSGTTLLRHLLNSHSQIQCDGEILRQRVFSPVAHLERRAALSTKPAYGAKFLSYQMVQIYRMTDPRRFLEDLARRNIRLIHLQRRTLDQTISLLMAQKRTFFHHRPGTSNDLSAITVDPDQFVDRIRWSEALLENETEMLQDFEHLTLRYEQDLLQPEAQIETIARLCAALGLAAETPRSDLRKVLPSDPRSFIENFDALCQALTRSGYGHLL